MVARLPIALFGVFLGTLAASATSSILSLVPPVETRGSSVIGVDLVLMNNGLREETLPDLPLLNGSLLINGASVPVTLHADGPLPAPVVQGAFARRLYTLPMPADTTGPAILEVTTPQGIIRTALLVQEPGSVSATPSVENAAVTSPFDVSKPAADRVQRAYAGRFAPHEPVYFLYGGDTPAAKFQFSFKYRLMDFSDEDAIAQRSLQFAYTQRSLWDVTGESSPFYDTSYMPALFFESLSNLDNNDSWFHWLGWQGGFQHESNGRDGDDSRSMNTVFVRPGVAFGDLDGWHLLVVPKFYAYLGGISDSNPDIKDYRGYAELTMIFGRNDGLRLSYTARAGQDLGHGSTQLDLTVPLRMKLFDFATFAMVQYYNGYGESLLGYNVSDDSLRAGFSLVR